MEYQLWCFFCVIHWAITTQICYMFIWIFHRCNALGSSGLPPSRWLLRCAVSRPELNIAVTCLVFYISVRGCTYHQSPLPSDLPLGGAAFHPPTYRTYQNSSIHASRWTLFQCINVSQAQLVRTIRFDTWTTRFAYDWRNVNVKM